MRGANRNRLIASFAIAALATLLAWAATHLKSVRDLEQVAYDLRVLAFAPATQPSDKVVMVWLDEATMEGLPYRSPVPRDFLATLHREIVKAEPWMVGYDIFFKDPSFSQADSDFRDALEGSVTYAVVPRRPDGVVDMPLPMFEQVLVGVGLANLPFNPFDATVRKARFSFDTDRGRMDSFAAAIFSAATGVDAATSIREGVDPPGWGPFETTPFVERGEVLIRFAGPPGKIGGKDNSFKTYSASLVAKGLVPKAWLQDKIVLVGAAYEDLKDAYLTPYYARATGYARMPGVEIHANILSSLMTNGLYFALTPWQSLAWVALFALAVAFATSFLSPWRSAASFAFAAAAAVVLSIAIFRSAAVAVPMVAPLFAQIASLGLGLGWRAMTEGRQRRFIKGVFARYVPAAVVDRMIGDPKLLRLGGETRRVTSLFSDIASFTTISERLDPETLVSFLNDYLGRMNEVLFRFGATLDKYEGDAIIAFFNAPLDVQLHEESAVRAALGMRRVDGIVSEAWRGRCGREITTRIGVNTGPAVVGNMGSEGRFDYTAIGDTINLASRLEGANKFYDTRIMASESTAAKLGEQIVKRPLDRIRVKGKSEPILIYEIVGEKAEVEAEVKEFIERYKEAFELFQARRLDEALAMLEKVIRVRPDDGPSIELRKRCERARDDADWDLVTDMTSK